MEQKNYTLKECRAFNQRSFELTTKFVNGNFQNGECKELILPDEAHPWTILHAVIDQYYKREYAMAQTIDIARCEMERATKMMDKSNEWDNSYWQMQKEIGDLKQMNEQLRGMLPQSEKSQDELPKALQELLQHVSPAQWNERIGYIIDALITALDWIGGNTMVAELYNARALQKFFISLEREIN